MVSAAEDYVLPCDPRAESALINYALTYPRQVFDLGVVAGDVYDPRRRALWQAIVSTALEAGELASGAFVEQLLVRATRAEARYSVREMLSSVDKLADWLCEAWTPESSGRDVEHWVGRVKSCVCRRRLIDAAQRIAERASKEPDFDVSQASAVLERVAGVPTREKLGLDLPI